ncbi:hypothetical protein H4R18_000144 [Coemansia javaensis]|uniref:Lysosomal dipeptide transporter MFSD1 n=1 Tax=Coemansia javaensis TaxID=2761396 RepID=A0A9W8LNI7_9FUNG|nr:hypothetical protein H4R18_000144 [Coemansia javaensis]
MMMMMIRRVRVTRLHMVQAAVLMIVVMMSWGKRMGSSLMSPLKSTLKQELGINNTEWASLISMVWVVGTVSPFVAGLLLDAMGAPLAGVVAIALILAGNGICAIAVAARSLGVFLAGRAVYSLGGGAVFLVGEVILLKWFKGRQLPVAFGCLSTVGGLMSFSGPAVVSAVLSRGARVTVPFWLATGLSAFGLLCFGVYGLIHNSHYAQDVEQQAAASEPGASDASASSFDEKPRIDEAVSVSSTKKSGSSSSAASIREPEPAPWSNNSSSTPAPTGTAARCRRALPELAARCGRLVSGLAALPETYWYVLLCISIQGTLFIPLHEIVPEMMETEWGYSRAQSSKLFVYLHIIPIVMHITLGVLINRIGHRISIFFAGSALIFLAAVFITFVRRVPVVLSLVIMNLSGSMVPAAIFSLMNLVIDNGEVAGAALGLIRSAEFASVTLMEMLDGLLQDADHNRYDTVLIGLVVFSGLLLLVGAASLVGDRVANGGLLNSADPYSRPQPAPAAGPIPRRRYIYLGVIALLLVTAWGLFIASLARM